MPAPVCSRGGSGAGSRDPRTLPSKSPQSSRPRAPRARTSPSAPPPCTRGRSRGTSPSSRRAGPRSPSRSAGSLRSSQRRMRYSRPPACGFSSGTSRGRARARGRRYRRGLVRRARERPRDLRHDGEIVPLGPEVSEAREEVDDRPEAAVGERKRAHVAADECEATGYAAARARGAARSSRDPRGGSRVRRTGASGVRCRSRGPGSAPGPDPGVPARTRPPAGRRRGPAVGVELEVLLAEPRFPPRHAGGDYGAGEYGVSRAFGYSEYLFARLTPTVEFPPWGDGFGLSLCWFRRRGSPAAESGPCRKTGIARRSFSLPPRTYEIAVRGEMRRVEGTIDGGPLVKIMRPDLKKIWQFRPASKRILEEPWSPTDEIVPGFPLEPRFDSRGLRATASTATILKIADGAHGGTSLRPLPDGPPLRRPRHDLGGARPRAPSRPRRAREEEPARTNTSPSPTCSCVDVRVGRRCGPLREAEGLRAGEVLRGAAGEELS